MDFGLVGKLVRSNSATAGSNNGGSLASETDLRLYGSAFLNKDNTAVEDELPPAKAARISPCGGDMAKVSLQECNNGGVSTQQMLCFSPRDASFAAFPFLRSSSGPFTPSQWMELEHQALIYKYITANVPIPSYLLMPIRKAVHAASGILSCFSLQTPNPLGWLGFSKADPEPGRCRRTDGKKWRCSRDAVADHKYCERHMNRGRHRSRKPVEPQPQPKPVLPAKTTIDRCLIAAYSDSLVSSRNRGGDGEDERKSEHSLRHLIDEWPQNQLSLSRESNSWVPISWEASVGGPLGEALQKTSECKSSKVENSSTLGAFIGPGLGGPQTIAPGLMPALSLQHSIPTPIFSLF